MADLPVFWLEPTNNVRVRLRRYRAGAGTCGSSAYCDADVVIRERAPAAEWRQEFRIEQAPNRPLFRTLEKQVDLGDPRWPRACAACGTEFPDDAARQVWADLLYSGAPDGRLYSLRDAPVGSIYDADWLNEVPRFTGPDGIALTVVTPGGVWHVDSEASNCTRPGDLSHKCWVRRGDPRDPQGIRTGQPLHVDKAGATCAAGAGSIQCGRYHGFLHHGRLTGCG